VHSSLIVRDSILDDLPEVYRVRSHEMVRPHQYRIVPDPDKIWEQWIQQNARVGDHWFRVSTILYDQKVAGYVAQTITFTNQQPFADCGWNLAPDYWGRGIMRAALQVILQRLFTEDKMQYVIADCFRNNVRCKRLLSKLHFTQIGIPVFERVKTACQMRCLHWVERYCIDCGAWSNLQQHHTTRHTVSPSRSQ
jgi:RimJ/RimL family protein N-acetyltransferase